MLISAQTTCHVVLHLPHVAKFNIIQKNVKTEGENMKLKSTRKRDEKVFDPCRNNCHLLFHICHMLHGSTKKAQKTIVSIMSLVVWIDHRFLQVPPAVTMSYKSSAKSFCLCFYLVLWNEEDE